MASRSPAMVEGSTDYHCLMRDSALEVHVLTGCVCAIVTCCIRTLSIAAFDTATVIQVLGPKIIFLAETVVHEKVVIGTCDNGIVSFCPDA